MRLSIVRRKRDAERLADRLRLRHHALDEFARRRIAADIFERGVGERAHGIEARVAPQLHPDFHAKIGDHRRLEAGAGKSLRQRRDARGGRIVDLAEREAVALDVADHARRRDFGGGIDDAAEDAVDRQMRGDRPAGIDALEPPPLVLAAMLEEVPPGDAVLRREDRRFAAEQRRDRRRRRRRPDAPSWRG